MLRVPQSHGTSAVKFALAQRDKARTESKIEREWQSNSGPFESVGYVCTRQYGSAHFRSHNILVASVRTCTLYIISFEAPVNEWPAAWMTATPIIQKLYLNDEV